MVVIGAYGILELTASPEWYHYVMAIICTPLALGLIMRQVIGYKTISLGKQKLIISYKFRGKTISYNLKELSAWRENVVKTPSGTFKELNLLFRDDKRIDFSMQEYSHYDKVISYLRKNNSKKYRDS